MFLDAVDSFFNLDSDSGIWFENSRSYDTLTLKIKIILFKLGLKQFYAMRKFEFEGSLTAKGSRFGSFFFPDPDLDPADPKRPYPDPDLHHWFKV